MGLPNEIHPFLVTGNNANQYKIPYSLRFRNDGSNGAKLVRTFQNAGNRKTWTWSVWLKLGRQAQADSFLFAYNSGGGYNRTYHELLNGTITIGDYTTGYVWQVATNQLLRDYSAWYHYVVQFDTTQATASNRVRLYLNGSQITSLATANYPSLNYDAYINQAAEHVIGSIGYANNSGFDGYMAEMHFVDGYAYDPSYFGYTDTLTNQWQPKKYTGAYGVNGFYLPFKDNTTATSENLVNYSEQIDNAYWGKYYVTASSNVTTAPNGATVADSILETSDNNLHTITVNGGSGLTVSSNATYTLSVYVKPINKTAIQLVFDNAITTSGGYANYDLVNGLVVGPFNYGTGSGAKATIQSVANGWFRISLTTAIGAYTGSRCAINAINSASTDGLFPGYVGNTANGYYIWGAQFEQSSSVGPYFPTVASTSVSTYRIGRDASNGDASWNNWIGYSMLFYSPANTTTYLHDSYIDSPTSYDDGSIYYNRGNYPTLNPISSPVNTIYTVSNGNLTYYCPASSGNGGRMTIAATYGLGTAKYYWEVYPTDTNGGFGLVGYYNQGLDPTATANPGNTLYILCFSAGQGTNNITLTYTGTTFSYAANDLIGLAYDGTAGTLAFYKNGTLIGTYSGISTSYLLFPGQCANASAAATNFSINFGQRPFKYTPPAGYAAINSYNLQNPSLPLV